MTNEDEAERALQSLGLDIISDQDLEQWNQDKNQAGMFEKDASPQEWKDEGFLTKEFYVRDPDGHDFGVYRKAWYGEYAGGSAPGIFITDANHNELDISQVDSNVRPGPKRST